MKVAQIAPLSESVPPKLFGGTERVVSYLIEELVRRGTIDDAVAAVARIGTLDRARVRAAFERRFSVERMADDYLAAYASLREAPSAGAALADVA